MSACQGELLARGRTASARGGKTGNLRVEIDMEKARKVVVLGACVLIAACGESADREQPPSRDTVDPVDDVTTPSVHIVSPAEGDVLERGAVTVRLEVEGIVVVPAGVEQASSGHHHLLVDAPLPDLDLPIPSEPGRYIHLGRGQTEYVIEELDVGQHQVIALLGDHVHVPLSPPVADTVRFVVH
ncbi:MAG: DUF4399 domain-containing protein [Gemmatimonadetes bacterium]|nr:DUF4399 domain-containing protein [Gemmatimonadota bacterium]